MTTLAAPAPCLCIDTTLTRRLGYPRPLPEHALPVLADVARELGLTWLAVRDERAQIEVYATNGQPAWEDPCAWRWDLDGMRRLVVLREGVVAGDAAAMRARMAEALAAVVGAGS